MIPNLEIAELPEYLLVKYSGRFDLTSALDSVDSMVKTCQQLNKNRVLFDCTDMTGELTVLDRYEVGRYSGAKVDTSLKIAMVGGEEYVQPNDFFETVTRNRGINLKVFVNLDEASEWLIRQD